MFFQFAFWNAGLAPALAPTANMIRDLTNLHPETLLLALERYFATRPAPPADHPDYRRPNPLPLPGAPVLEAQIDAAANPGWDHAIYAYMIENARTFEIFDRVIREYEGGERFETPQRDAAMWLRATEALFYRDLGSGSIGSMTSWLRSDLRATRRNIYYRLLGLDLNHGMDGNRAYPFEKPAASNRDFVPTFEAFLYEVWRGGMNANNGIGPNETDHAAIANLALRLREMLRVRRLHGNLIREEYWATVTMSWFHLAVADNTPIVLALKAEAESPADRLRKLGERVGIPAHSRANSYFQMAFELSSVLAFIETNVNATDPAYAAGYYNLGGLWPVLAAELRTIITHWSVATGREIKGMRSAATVALSAPTTPAPILVGRSSVARQALPLRQQ